MAREPLMLSDTAMVLLRHYDELDNKYLTEMVSKLSLTLTVETLLGIRADIFTKSQLREVIKSEFLDETWLLWRFQETSIMRVLEWHFVFNETLMTMAETMFSSWNDHPQPYRRFIINTSPEVSLFFDALSKDYKTALAAHTSSSENS